MSKELTTEQIKTRTEKQTKKFIKAARDFMAAKGGGSVRPEWELSLQLLEEYYRQFTEISLNISQLDSLVINGKYGPMPTPLLACRDKASVRLEALMKEMGITLKSGIKLNVVEPKKTETVLDKYMKGKIEQR